MCSRVNKWNWEDCFAGCGLVFLTPAVPVLAFRLLLFHREAAASLGVNYTFELTALNRNIRSVFISRIHNPETARLIRDMLGSSKSSVSFVHVVHS